MSDRTSEWTLDGFVDHFDFVHHKMLDHKYVWMLGAGASYASGIPLGTKLVDDWLTEIHVREDSQGLSLEEWATEARLGIKNFRFKERASFYPRIYERRFKNYPDAGYAYLESVMSGRDPSPGYSILASILALDPPRHNVVITTNFDNLVADALSIYTDTFPFVAGHESLTSFVRVSMRRPLICKIHRDLLLGPQNDSRSLKRLHDAWGTALRTLFQHYTPLFIGYGGNDDTLMDLLESLSRADIKGELVWCYHEESEPSQRIRDVVTDLEGVLVAVPDFDLLMVLLGERMEIGLLDQEIGQRATQRTERYRDRIQRLDTVKHPSVTRALAATFDRSGGWWAWEQKARAEKDYDRRETVYEQGVKQYPESALLHCAFGTFFWTERRDFSSAEPLLKKSLELEPSNAIVINNFAFFLTWRKSLDEAEKLFRKAVELEPENHTYVGNFASFLTHVRGEHVQAELLFTKSVELAPTDAYNYSRYCSFLLSQGRLSEAINQLELAKNANKTGDFALKALLLLYSAIIDRANNKDDTKSICELIELLSDDAVKSFALIGGILKFVESKLSPADYKLFSTLAEALHSSLARAELSTLLQQREAANFVATV